MAFTCVAVIVFMLIMPLPLESWRGKLLLACPSVRASVHVSVTNVLRYSFEISYMDTSSKNN